MSLKNACLTGATAATAIAAVLAGVAPAANAAGGGDEVTVTPKHAPAGSDVRFQAQCPERTVTHRVVVPQVVDMPMPGSGRAVDKTLTILADAPTGKHKVEVLCYRSGSVLATLTGSLTVDAPTPPPGAAKGKVVARSLHVRSGVDTKAKIVGRVRGGQILQLECKTPGQNVRGNRLWYKIANVDSQWVSARYVKNLNRVPVCPV
ncbi:SH3 domain-containing protein [Streptomyces sp. A7024]|uniref:SH3 domain-containing protein n=1 Tax=Streptomyces coryli TaxID=1128680 RepID=A0A6G4UAR5_9ACTN|nr:SH3 domain-containing protein [Streptomyces coryli]NGN68776.1 SH3 domain-containing protein [Streptomyces coryli]